jgi:hypothetical protein
LLLLLPMPPALILKLVLLMAGDRMPKPAKDAKTSRSCA